MFQNIFIFRTVEFVSQAVEVLRKHCAAISQRGIHEPECSVTLGKQAYHSSADNDLYLLDCREHKETQFLVKVIERDYMSESRASLESVQTFVNFHQSPIARQPEITNCIQNVSRLFDILYQETALLQNINLLLERKQLLSIFHNVQTKKMARPGTLHSLRTRSGGGIYWVQSYDFLLKHPNDLAKKCIKR